MEALHPLLQKLQILTQTREEITICPVTNAATGITCAKQILDTVLDRKTVLFLSGGRTPKDMYEALAHEGKLVAGAVGLIDERYGKKLHTNSNEKMIQDTGLLSHIEKQNIRFYPILNSHPEFLPADQQSRSGFSQILHPIRPAQGLSDNRKQVQHDKMRKQTAMHYDETVRSLLTNFPTSIGILGIGLDGHTAGIAGNRIQHPVLDNPLFHLERKNLFVSEFDDPEGMFKQRITMTFLGLSMLDVLLVLVFGDDKKEALQQVFTDGSEEEIPARFFKRPEIAQKTLLITDQSV